MSKRFLELYALSVCFVSMGCLSIFGGIFLYGLVELSFPEAANSSRMHYPPPVFSQSGGVTTPIFPGQPLPGVLEHRTNQESIEEKKRFKEESKRFEELEMKRLQAESFMSIVRSLIVLLISSIVFAFHWRIAKKARNEND